MPDVNQPSYDETLAVPVDADLTTGFLAAAAAEDKPAADLLRDFVASYVEAHRKRVFAAEARRQSLIVAQLAEDPNSDEAEVMRWIEAVQDTDGWVA